MRVALFLSSLLFAGQACAQSSPNWVTQYVPSASEWNSTFAGKADAANGVLTNPTISGALITASAFNGGTITGGSESGLARTGGSLDGAPIGATTPAAGSFTTLNTTGAATVRGALNANAALNVLGDETISGEIHLTGGTFTTAGSVPGILYFSNMTGTPTGSGTAYANLLLANDNLPNANGASLLGLLHNYGGASVNGGRNTLQIKSFLTSQSGQTGGNYTGFQVYAGPTANDNGTSGSPSGAYWTENMIVKAYTPSSGNGYFNAVTGNEYDIGCQTNTFCQQKVGVYVLDTFDDVNAASWGAVAFHVATQLPSSAPGWDCAFCIGDFVGGWPFPNGTGIAYGPLQKKGGVQPNGLIADRALTDMFDARTTHATEWQFAGAGFDVGPTGTTYIGTGAIAPTTTGMSIDVTQTQVSAVSVVTAGHGYTTNDYAYGPNGGIYHVTGISGGGAVTTIAIVAPDVYPVGGTPSNPVTLRYGSGDQTLTANLTWTSGTTLSLVPSGATLKINGTNAVSCAANGVTLATFVVTNGVVTHC